MRLALIHRGDGSFKFVWSHHHLLLDGWSVALLFREFFTLYLAFERGRNGASGTQPSVPRLYRLAATARPHGGRDLLAPDCSRLHCSDASSSKDERANSSPMISMIMTSNRFDYPKR